MARRSRAHYVAAVAWLAFTVSLASWWLSVGLALTDRHRMFLWEGTVFIVVLVGGGIAILIAIHREDRRRQALDTFFMSFTHDLKTSLASVQLQAEGLREDRADTAESGSIDRLLQDLVRLQIQLENSLFVAQPDGRLLQERLDIAAAIDRLREDWPGLMVTVRGNGHVRADARAFDVVLRNLLQNAVVHGGASSVVMQIDRGNHARMVRLVVADDGPGLSRAQLAQLGEPFARPGATSGTGAGLYVSRRLVTRMGGSMTFDVSKHPPMGLKVTIELPEAD